MKNCRQLILFVVLLLAGQSSLLARNNHPAQDIDLLTVISLLSAKYNVYFTYDRTLVDEITVEYDEQKKSSIDQELEFLLQGTDLKYKIFDNQFVILFKETREGLNSLKEMMKHFEKIIKEKENLDDVSSRRLNMKATRLLPGWKPPQRDLKGVVLQVSGTVADEDGEPLIGVNISVKNRNIGTSSDFNGEYNLPNVEADDVLVFSYIGYQKVEIPIDGRTVVNVQMLTDTETLEELIVVGYGTQKKVNVSGAVDYIDGREIESRPVANVMQGLQGLSPGLNINYAGGTPGAKPKINIRGFTSINGGSPLVIIDGIASSYDDLLRINPGDIASYSILKDAASAAIYGARAAFGVILITTKSGTTGQPKVEYRNFVAWGKPTVLPIPVTDPYIFSRVKEISTNNTPWDYVNYSDEHFRWAKERSEDPSVEEVRVDPNDPTRWAYMGDNNWYDYFLNDAAVSYNHSLSFSGGLGLDDGRQIGYYLSADLTNENGLNKLAEDYFNRKGLRAKINFDPYDWLELQNNASLYQTERVLPRRASLTDIYYRVPIDVVKNPDGTWANTDVGRMAAQLVDGGDNFNTLTGFQDILTANASFFDKSLVITGRASFKNELWKYTSHNKEYQLGIGPGFVETQGGPGSVSETNGQLKNTILDLFASYTRTLNNHYFKVLAGVNQENYTYSSLAASKDVLISSSLPYINLTSGDPTINAGYSSYATRSVFGRFNYHFKDRYLFELNGRYDGSSRFPRDGRWGFFPSVSVGYVISEEPFVKDLFIHSEPFIKFRASYGDLGNQSVGNFAYIQTLGTGNSPYLINGGRPTVITGGAPSLQIDPTNYTWERVSTLNFGLDVAFIQGKLQGTFDIYNRKTLGMLTQGQELPAVLGTSVPDQNIADLETKGWEMSLSYRDGINLVGKPLDFDIKLIVSDSRSWITKFQNDLGLFSSWREGEEIGELWGLISDGVFTDQEEIDALDETELIPWGALSIVPGWPKYIDQDGNGAIQLGKSENDVKDLVKIGNTSSRYRVGANLSGNWNGIDLSIFLQGVLKRDFYPQHYLYWGPYQQPYANIYPWNLDFYRDEADSESLRSQHSQSYIDAGLADKNLHSTFPVLQSWLADDNYGNAGLDIPQTSHLLNGAYLRLKNITLGYTLPTNLTSKVKVDRLRIFFTGENLYEFSPIKEFMDPEAVEDGYGWAYPFQRKMSVGLNIYF